MEDRGDYVDANVAASEKKVNIQNIDRIRRITWLCKRIFY